MPAECETRHKDTNYPHLIFTQDTPLLKNLEKIFSDIKIMLNFI